MKTLNLDDPEMYRVLDPSGLRHRLRTLPGQCLEGWRRQPSHPLPAGYRKSERIVVLGVGGSAMAGDYLKGLMPRLGGPTVEVHRGFSCGTLDERALVITCSYSGNTEETLAAYQEASRESAFRVVLTSGGRLKALAEKDGVPIYAVDLVSEPRAAFGYSLCALLACVRDLGLVAGLAKEIDETVPLLQAIATELEETSPVEHNEAKRLAWELFESLIVVYGSDIFSCVAHRWKTQFNENGKSWAFHEELPEAGHNAVEGLERPGNLTDMAVVLLLYSSTLPAWLESRYEGLEELLEAAQVRYKRMEARGSGPLSQMMSLTLLGDYASYYLGMLYGRDPSPAPFIDRMKKYRSKPTSS